jgi:hypothetical protein
MGLSSSRGEKRPGIDRRRSHVQWHSSPNQLFTAAPVSLVTIDVELD